MGIEESERQRVEYVRQLKSTLGVHVVWKRTGKESVHSHTVDRCAIVVDTDLNDDVRRSIDHDIDRAVGRVSTCLIVRFCQQIGVGCVHRGWLDKGDFRRRDICNNMDKMRMRSTTTKTGMIVPRT